jgi:hypothetical protein
LISKHLKLIDKFFSIYHILKISSPKFDIWASRNITSKKLKKRKRLMEKISAADPGCLSRILDLIYPSRIPDLESRNLNPGSKNNRRRGGGKIYFLFFIVAKTFTK